MNHEIGITNETTHSKCDYCAKYAQCHTIVIDYGMCFQTKQICLMCESANKHQGDMDQVRFNNLMKDDLDGYPDDRDL